MQVFNCCPPINSHKIFTVVVMYNIQLHSEGDIFSLALSVTLTL